MPASRQTLGPDGRAAGHAVDNEGASASADASRRLAESARVQRKRHMPCAGCCRRGSPGQCSRPRAAIMTPRDGDVIAPICRPFPWARLVSNQRPLACEAICHPARKRPFCLQMHMIGFERPKLRLTEFAFVSQEFGPREPARGPFRPTDRALTRADQNAEPVTRKDRVVRSSSRGNGRLKRPQSNCC